MAKVLQFPKSRGKSRAVAPGSLKLPEGFREIGALVPFWQMEAEPQILGTVASFGLIPGKEVKKKDPKTGKSKLVKEPDRKTIILKCEDGRSRTVGESGALRRMFSEVKKGDRVYLRYNGKRKDRKDPTIKYNDITVAVDSPESDEPHEAAKFVRAKSKTVKRGKRG